MQHVEVEQYHMNQESNEEQQFGERNYVHMATFEFVYDEKRSLKKCHILTKFMLLIYHITSILVSIPLIETNDNLFISYCIALIGMSISTFNLIRYEHAHYKIYGRIFRSLEEFKFWRRKQLPVLNYVFNGLEVMLQIYFLIVSWPLKFDTFAAYEVSIGLLQIQIILLVMLGALMTMFSCCIAICAAGHSVQVASLTPSSRQVPLHGAAPPPPNSLTTIIISCETFTDSGRECCICLDKNTKPWITTRCSHSFHQECISHWTQNNRATCPVCRSNLFQDIQNERIT